MAEDASKLVEEVVETTESTEVKDEFNPLAFTSDVDTYGELDSKKESSDDNEEDSEKVESKEKTEEEEQSEQEEGWAWDSKEKEDVKTEEEDDYNWDGVEEKTEEAPTKEESLTWAKVGKEIGIEIMRYISSSISEKCCSYASI